MVCVKSNRECNILRGKLFLSNCSKFCLLTLFGLLYCRWTDQSLDWKISAAQFTPHLFPLQICNVQEIQFFYNCTCFYICIVDVWSASCPLLQHWSQITMNIDWTISNCNTIHDRTGPPTPFPVFYSFREFIIRPLTSPHYSLCKGLKWRLFLFIITGEKKDHVVSPSTSKFNSKAILACTTIM